MVPSGTVFFMCLEGSFSLDSSVPKVYGSKAFIRWKIEQMALTELTWLLGPWAGLVGNGRLIGWECGILIGRRSMSINARAEEVPSLGPFCDDVGTQVLTPLSFYSSSYLV